MSLWSKHKVGTKIAVESRIIEKVSKFNYLGCEISPEVEHDFENKVSKFRAYVVQFIECLSIEQEMKLKFYKNMAVPANLFGSEA